MSEKKKIVAGLTLRQLYSIGGLLVTGTAGGVWGVPFFQQQLDRIDIIIYLFCDRDQTCVDSAWHHIIHNKQVKKAQGGGH